MASGETEEDDGSIQLDIDNVHMLLQGQSVCVLECDDYDVGSTTHQIFYIFVLFWGE